MFRLKLSISLGVSQQGLLSEPKSELGVIVRVAESGCGRW